MTIIVMLLLFIALLSIPSHSNNWQSSTVNNTDSAEELLDWADDHGFLERQLEILSPSEFVVKWR